MPRFSINLDFAFLNRQLVFAADSEVDETSRNISHVRKKSRRVLAGRKEFLDRVAAPVADKLLECGMIP